MLRKILRETEDFLVKAGLQSTIPQTPFLLAPPRSGAGRFTFMARLNVLILGLAEAARVIEYLPRPQSRSDD